MLTHLNRDITTYGKIIECKHEETVSMSIKIHANINFFDYFKRC